MGCMAKSKPRKVEDDHCDKLRASLQKKLARLKESGVPVKERKLLKEQISILNEQINEECSDSKIRRVQ